MVSTVIEFQSARFNSSGISAILSKIEEYFNSSAQHVTVKRSVFSISMEALQNMLKHRDVSETPCTYSLLHDPDAYRIQTTNIIRKAKSSALKSKLRKINTCSFTELKALYQKTLLTTTPGEASGAGLGLIQMARRSGKKLDVEFMDLNVEYSLFQLTATVSKR